MSNESEYSTNLGVSEQTMPGIVVPAQQLVYLDFDGADTAYHGEVLTVDNVHVDNSGFYSEDITLIVDSLNAQFGDSVVFTATLPDTIDTYSTIYIGVTSAFDEYGAFLGLAETVDSGNLIPDDNAFVLLDSTAATKLVTSVIAHETQHLVGTLDHGGEGVARYAADINVTNGQTVDGAALNFNTSMYVRSGGTANSTIVNNGGDMRVFSGGTANSMTVNSGGNVRVSSGGTALNVLNSGGIVWAEVIGGDSKTLVSGTNADGTEFYVSNGIAYNLSGGGWISCGGTANSTTVNRFGWLTVSSGGTANSTTVNSGGGMDVSSGGTANSTTVNSSGGVYVLSGGTANSTIVNSDGRVYVYGAANSTTVNRGGYVSVYSGGTALNVLNSGGIVWADIGGDSKTIVSGTNADGTDFYVSNGIAYNLNGGGRIFGWGTANYTTVNSRGAVHVSSWGTANYTTVNSLGCVFVSSRGTANSTTVNSGGYVYVNSGGTALNVLNSGGIVCAEVIGGDSKTIVSGTNADGTEFYVSNGIAYNLSGGGTISSGGTANSTTVNSRGSVYVSSGGTALNVLNSGGIVLADVIGGDSQTIVSGANADGTEFYVSNGIAYNLSGGGRIRSGGTANSTTVNSFGWLVVSSGGTANVTEVASGGSLFVSAGGFLRGETVLAGAVEVDGSVDATGAVIDFAVNQRTTADARIINDLSKINGATYTVTVSDAQAQGKYKLADGASAFNGTITVKDTNEVNYGMLRVGNELEYGGYLYSLEKTGATLMLTVAALPAAVFLCDSENNLISSAMTMSGITLNMETLRVSSGGLVESTTANEIGTVFVFNGGVANSTIVNSFGGLVVSSGGTANHTLVNSHGKITIFAGGTANDTTLSGYYNSLALLNNKSALLQINSGGLANSTTVNSGGTACVSNGGTANSIIVNQGGSALVFSGGTVNYADLNGKCQGRYNTDSAIIGYMYVSGGLVNHVIVSSGGDLVVSEGGIANSTTVDGDGKVVISNGGTVNHTIVKGATLLFDLNGNGRGSLYVRSGGHANFTTVNSGGEMDISSGGTAQDTTVESGGSLFVSAGGFLRGDTVLAGTVQVDGNVDATEATIDFALDQRTITDAVIISDLSKISGASYAITVAPDQAEGTYKLANGASDFTGTITVKDTSDATYGTLTVGDTLEYDTRSYSLDNAGGTLTLTIAAQSALAAVFLYDSEDNLVSSGVTMTEVVVNAKEKLLVSNGGTANFTTVNSSGSMVIYTGGTANSTFITHSGVMRVFSGGTANETSILAGGTQTVSMGSALNTVINGTTELEGFQDDTRQDIWSGGYASHTTVKFLGFQFVSSGGTALDTFIEKDAGLIITSGAYVSGVVQSSGGGIGVRVYGNDSDTKVYGSNERGSFNLVNGVASNFVLYDIASGTHRPITPTYMYVYAGGTALSTFTGSDGNTGSRGTVIMSGGLAEDTIGHICFYSGGTANRTVGTVWMGQQSKGSNAVANYTIGYVDAIRENCIANYTTGYVGVSNGGIANYTIVTNSAYVYSGGTANSTTVASGAKLTVSSGGTANVTEVASGASLTVSANGLLRGETVLGGRLQANGTVDATGAIIDLAVNQRTTTDAVIINDLSKINGATYTVTVSDIQAQGKYKLAGGASTFNGTITVKNTDDEVYGAISTGESVTANERTYTLLNETGVLSLQVQAEAMDKTPPTITNITANVTSPTNGNVTVTAVFADDVALKSQEYKIGDGAWTAYTNGAVATSNATVQFRAIDSAGNTTVSSYAVTNIDKTAPTITNIGANVTAPTNSNVVVTANFADDRALKSREYKIGDGAWTAYTDGGVVMADNGTIQFRATDSAGNRTSASYAVTNIDKTAPTITNIGANITTPTNGNVTVTAVFGDNVTLASTQYRIGNGSWQSYANGVTMTQNGTVEFRATDTAGNSATSSYAVGNIDKTVPTITNIGANITTPTNGNVVVSASFADDVALASTQYRIGGGIWQAYVDSVTITQNGTVEFRATDTAGNSATANYDVTNINRVAPPRPTASASTTEPTNQNVTVTATFTGSVAEKQYSLDSTTWSVYPAAGVVMSANGTVWFRAKDSAGNVSEPTGYEVTNIDKVAPTITGVGANVTAPTNGDVVVSASFADDVALKSKEYKIGNGAWTAYTNGVVVTSNATVQFRAIDSAGNSAMASYAVTNIDKVAPATPVATASTTTLTNQSVTVTATFSSDSTAKQYSQDGVTWESYTKGIMMTDNGTVWFRGIDAAGNISDIASYMVSNIDKEPPSKPTATASTTAVTNQDVIVTADFSGDTAIKQYSLDGTAWNNYPAVGVTMPSNGTVWFRGIDTAGNVSEATTYSVTNIDKEPPAKPTATASTTAPTNQNVTVTAVFSADTATKQYSLDNQSWSTYTEGVVMSDNGTVWFRGIDAAGSVSEATRIVVNNIDKIAPAKPTARASTTELTNQDVTITASFSADTVTKQYSLDGEAWSAYTTGVKLSANKTVWFRGIDAASNISEVASYEVTNIDKVAPAKPTATASTTEPTNQDVVVTAVFSGDAVTKQYSLDNQHWNLYTQPIAMSENGTIWFRAVDEAGNISEVASCLVSNIDKVAPNKPTATASTTEPTNQDVTVTAVFSGDTVAKQYSRNNKSWNAYTGGVVMATNGKVWFRGIDTAGNISAVTVYEVTNITKTAPEPPVVTADIIGPTNQNVTVSATFSGTSSRKEYSQDGTSWNPYTQGIVMSDNGTLYFRGVDAAGNISTVASYTVSNIDKVAPNAPTAAASTTDLINEEVVVTATFSSDTATKQYSLDGTTWRSYTTGVVMDENGTVWFRGIDAAGNISAATSYVVGNIDKVPPSQPAVQASTTDMTNQNVTVTATFSGDAVTKQYSLDGETWHAYTAGVVMEANGTVQFRAVDAAGNISLVASYTVENIDKEPPSAPEPYEDNSNNRLRVKADFSRDTVTKEYSYDGRNWQKYPSTGVPMTTNGTIWFRATDAAGNTSETQYDVSSLDSPPTIKFYYLEKLSMSLSYLLKIVAEDDSTSVNELKYLVRYSTRVDGLAGARPDTINMTRANGVVGLFTLKNEGTYFMQFGVEDKSGNITWSEPRQITVKKESLDIGFIYQSGQGEEYDVSSNIGYLFREDFHPESVGVYEIGFDEGGLTWTGANLFDTEKSSENAEQFALNFDACWAVTASNLFMQAGWGEGLFDTSYDCFGYFAEQFTTYKSPAKYGNLNISGYRLTPGNTYLALEWLMDGYGRFWKSSVFNSISKPRNDYAGGFYRELELGDYFSAQMLERNGGKLKGVKEYQGGNNWVAADVDSSFGMMNCAFERMLAGDAIGLTIGWYDDKKLEKRVNGHAVTVYGFAFDESKMTSPDCYTGIFIADPDDDFLVSDGHGGYALSGMAASEAPNKVRELVLDYLPEKGVYVFRQGNRYGVIEGFQYLAKRPEGVACTQPSIVEFASVGTWGGREVSFGADAASAIAPKEVGKQLFTDEENIRLAMNLLNAGAQDNVTFTVTVQDRFNAETTVILSEPFEDFELSQDEMTKEVLALGSLESGTHNLTITITNESGVETGRCETQLTIASPDNSQSGSGDNERISIIVVANQTEYNGQEFQANVDVLVKIGAFLEDSTLQGGTLTVENGAEADGVTINDGAIVTAYGILETPVLNDGTLNAFYGADVRSATLASRAAEMLVDYKGSANATDVVSGTLTVQDGKVSKTNVQLGGKMVVGSKGEAEGTVVNGGSQCISGGSAVGNTLSGGAVQEVFGGVVESSFLDNSRQELSNGATAYTTTLNGRSQQHLREAVAYGTVVGDKAAAFVHDDGLTVDCTVLAGGSITIGDGLSGTAQNLTVKAGGKAVFRANATLQGLTTIAGTLDVQGDIYGDSQSLQDSAPEIRFDFTEAASDAPYCINDLSKCHDVSFSITLDAGLDGDATYQLAATGAGDFADTISVYGINALYYGSLVLGNEVAMGDKRVSLNQGADGSLAIVVRQSNEGAFTIPRSTLDVDDNACNWGLIANATSYIIQFSQDSSFATAITVETDSSQVTLNNLSLDGLHWRVCAISPDGEQSWTTSSEVMHATEAANRHVTTVKNWDYDLLFANADERWGDLYLARHQGFRDSRTDGWAGTNETVSLAEKNKLDFVFEGNSDPNLLLLTDDANGDALFVDDIYSAFPDGLSAQARLSKLDEIRAGAGDDVVDLTSQHFEYVGGGITMRGGDGDDVLWANKGNNKLFGDAGNDRIVGAAGNDLIVAGAGNDFLQGGGGDDIFAFGGDWGNDTIKQLSGGKVTLWFDKGDATHWDDKNLTYTDGDKSVTVEKGVSSVELHFGNDDPRYGDLLAAGAFDSFTSQRIFEDTTKGMLA